MSVIKNLFKDYGDFTLQVPEMHIPDEGITVLWGASGSGKTTLLRHLIGLETCEGMSWELKGEDLCRLNVAERKLGVVFQSYDLFPHMSGKENIAFALEARGLKFEDEKASWEMLKLRLGLEKFWHRLGSQLSGGEAQRIALARALVARPRMLMLDEPFSNLDTQAKEDARNVLRQLLSNLNLPALLVSHDPADKDQLADSVVEMREGRIFTT